jgi:hypothetical protein
VHPLLEPPFGDQDIESRLINADDDAFGNQIAVGLLLLLVHVSTGLDVDTLLLCVLRRIFLRVARLNSLHEIFQVFAVLRLPIRKDGLELAVDDDISIPAGWACKVGVQRQVQRVVGPEVLGRLAGDEIFGPLHRLEDERLHALPHVRVVDSK